MQEGKSGNIGKGTVPEVRKGTVSCKKQSLLNSAYTFTCIYVCTYTHAHVCITSGRDNETCDFSGTQRGEEEAMATDSGAVGKVCKINRLERRRHQRVRA